MFSQHSSCSASHFPPLFFPRIQQVTGGSTWSDVAATSFNFSFVNAENTVSKPPEIIAKAFERYRLIMFSSAMNQLTYSNDALRGLTVKVNTKQTEKYVQFGVDESYQLSYKHSKNYAELTVLLYTHSLLIYKANTVFGVLRGLETLSQIVECRSGQCCVPDFDLSDSPRLFFSSQVASVY